jgi:MoaA/NifB/PqqE/SkfB family radical SAM enzyme
VTIRVPKPSLDEMYRGREGTLEKSIEFIKKARSYAIDTYVHFILDKFTIEYFIDTYQMVKDLDATMVVLPYIDFSGKQPHLMFSWDDFRAIADHLERQGVIVEMTEGICIAGVKRLAIDSFGNVRPCVYSDHDVNVGNLITEPWEEIYSRLCHWREEIGIQRGRCPAFDNTWRYWEKH